MSEKNDILDDNIINPEKKHVFYDKFNSYFEGVIRIGFYAYLSYSLISLLSRRNILNSSKEIIIGTFLGFILFQFFSVNHLIQGIRCFMPKKGRKINRFFTYASLIGLIVFFLAGIYYLIIKKNWIQITHYSIINSALIFILFSYLIYTEFKNIKSK
jgi:hypothetical protein